MEDHRRMRSQGPPSLPDGEELIQSESLPDPLRIERELRLARRVNTFMNVTKNTVGNSEILQVTNE